MRTSEPSRCFSQKVSLPDSLEVIESHAFHESCEIKEIVFGKSGALREIKENAFVEIIAKRSVFQKGLRQ